MKSTSWFVSALQQQNERFFDNGLLLHFEQMEAEEWLQASIAAYTGD